MAFISNADLRVIIADLYKKAGSGSLPTHQQRIVDRANARAQSDIIRLMRDRGYTAGQVDAWVDQAQANKDLGIYYTILEIGVLKRAYREQLDQYAKWIPDFDRGREWGLLQTCKVVDGAGALITPGATDAPINTCHGQINYDDMVDSQGCPIYKFRPNMDF